MSSLALEVTDVRVRFGGLVAVDGVSLRIPPRELRAVIGPNGAGKTTLFNAISGEVPLEQGTVRVEGADLTRLRPHKMRDAGLARGYQVPQVFGGMSVRENLWMAEIANSPTRLRPFARARALSDKSEAVEEICESIGLTHAIDRPADELSHADQKVLDIGIGLMSRPKVLLLDEPTQGVSPEEVTRIHEVVRKATERTTILMIEHNMETVLDLSDRVTVLARGAVIGEGTPREVMDNEEVQRVYMGPRARDGRKGE
jgi:branched-chain amino acid transport system ATP-binding protein